MRLEKKGEMMRTCTTSTSVQYCTQTHPKFHMHALHGIIDDVDVPLRCVPGARAVHACHIPPPLIRPGVRSSRIYCDNF